MKNSFKRLSVLMLGVFLFIGIVLQKASAAEIPFADVSRNWAYNSIVECYENGWITGTSSTTFSPKGTLTRAQFVTILGRYAGADVKKYKDSKFSDVDFSSWGYAPYVAWAEENAIAHGTDSVHFNPNGTVTRAQLAVFLYNYIQYVNVRLPMKFGSINFSDYDEIPSYARTAITTLAKAGVISGSNGKFDPGSACTREMAAAFLSKFNSALEKATYAPCEPQIVNLKCDFEGVPILKWSTVENATGYCIYRREIGTENWKCIRYWVKEDSYIDNETVMGTGYEYCVRAYIYFPESENHLWSQYGNFTSEIIAIPELTISPESEIYNDEWKTSSFYNVSTKDYYLIRSYLDAMKNGGILNLEAGTYNIPYTIYVPSNVTINLADGVVINKTAEVGTSPVDATSILFAFVDSSDVSCGNMMSAYDGVSNSKIYGTGNAEINIQCEGATAFLFAHNSDIQIFGLNIKLNDSGSYGTKIYGCKNLSISDCAITSDQSAVAAVLMETAGGTCATAPQKWCSLDGTLNQNIMIEHCDISGTQYGVHNRYYINNGYSSNISILNTNFIDISKEAIRFINDVDTVINGCTFWKIGGGAINNSYSAIHLFGTHHPSITDNSFDQLPYAITLASNSGDGTDVAVELNELDELILSSKVGSLYKYYVAVKMTDGNNIIRYFEDETACITINETSTPFQNRYTDYTDETRFYYNMRAALEQIEKRGGGKIIIESGNYVLTSELYIPSNTEIILMDGVTISKASGVIVMFAFANRQDITAGNTYTEYNGVHDSSVHGESKNASVILDNCQERGVIFEIGHTQNIEIYNIKMLNMHGKYHLIELDASYNVHIYNNIFEDCLDTGNEKEAINIDVPDPETGGFGGEYSSQDKTGNQSIYIYNNRFLRVPVGVGTHMYTDIAPHMDIEIYDNAFENILYYGIVAKNWDSCKIYDNEFNNIGIGGIGKLADVGCVFSLRGVQHPYITGNVVENANLLMRIDVLYYNGVDNENLLAYDTIYNEISDVDKNNFLENSYNNVTIPLIYYRNSKNSAYESWYKIDYTYKEIELDPSSEPYLKLYTNYDTYNDDTRMYYVLRSYMDHLAEIGGGIIHLAEGNYYIKNSINVPSNVSIIMEKNTIITNATDTKILFNLKEKDVVLDDVEAYGASENIMISGGKIDTNEENCQPIYIAKANGVTIKNVEFVNGCDNYIRVMSSKNVTIDSCVFDGTETSNGICITNAYSSVPCDTVTINNCKFSNLKNAILTNIQGTAYHNNIAITSSVFDNCQQDAIDLYMVVDCVINENIFSNMINESCYSLRLYGIQHITMNENQFKNVYNCGGIIYNKAYGKNSVSHEAKEEICKTTSFDENVINPYIIYQVDERSAMEKLYDISSVGTNFTISPNSETYLNSYKSNKNYNENTKQYYVLQSYLDLASGIDDNVTITLLEGDYAYTNTICIPSNVTLVLEEGATVRHASTGTAATLFIFAESSSTFNDISSVVQYGGVHNAAIKGTGTIDLEGQKVFAVTIPKCAGVTVEGVTFTGGAKDYYYIRDWSSKDVEIQNCNFEANASADNNGVAVSTYYSEVVCDGLKIQNCNFGNLKVSIYVTNSSSNLDYHKGIVMKGNTFTKTASCAIYGVGMYAPEITDNVLDGNNGSSAYLVQINGIVDPVVAGNVFKEINNCVQVSYKSPFDSNSISDVSKTIMRTQNNFGSCTTAIIYRQDANTPAEKWDVSSAE